MAPTFRHGKKVAVFVDEYHFSEVFNEFSVAASMEAAETTTFRKDDKTYIVGLRDVSISLSGLFASSGDTSTDAGASTNTDGMAEYFDGALGGSTRQVITILPDSTAVGARALLMTGDAVAWDVSAPVSDVVSAEVEFQGSQGYRGGRVLRYQVTSTSTGSQSAVDSGLTNGGSSGGGVGHLHVTSIASATRFATATFKIQHSTSGSTWADLITFAATTARTFQRSTVAGTIKEQVRSTISSYTATTNEDTITATITFARQAGPNRK